SPEKVATPPAAAWVSVPASTPPLGFVPIATVTFPVNPVAVLPLPSWAVTWTSGAISAPSTVVLGCTENTSADASTPVTLQARLASLPSPVAVIVYPVPASSILSTYTLSLHAALPIFSVPASTPPLGFVPIATVTFPVNPVAVLPLPSWAVTWTSGAIAAPATVVLGCT